jgi:hypothetical protein
MAKRPPLKKKEYRWRIVRLRATPAEFVGHVMAPDAESAVKKAIAEYEVTDPQHQKRLIAIQET